MSYIKPKFLYKDTPGDDNAPAQGAESLDKSPEEIEKEKSKIERSGVALEVMTEGMERKEILLEAGEKRTEAIQEVVDVDLDKSIEEQRENVETMEGFLFTAIPKLLKNGIEEPTTLEDFAQELNNLSEAEVKGLNPYGEVQALIMLRKVAENPQCALAKSWEFDAFLTEAKASYSRAKRLEERGLEKDEKPKDEESRFFGKIVDWMSDHRKHIVAGIALAGAIGAGVFVYKKLKKQKGWFKWGPVGAASIGTALVLGSTLGTDGWKDWVKDKLGLKYDLPHIIEAIPHLANGEFVKAWEVLKHGEIEIDPVSKMMGEKLGVKPDKLALLKDQKYSDFMSEGSQLLTAALAGAGEVGDTVLSKLNPDRNKAFAGQVQEKLDLLNAEKALHRFFKGADIEEIIEKEIKPGSDATIGEVLNELASKGYLGTAGVGAVPRPDGTPEDLPEGEEKAPKIDENIGLFVDGGSWNRLKGLFADNLENTGAYIEHHLEGASDCISWSFWSGFFEAIREDGAAIVTKEGVLYLVLETGMLIEFGSGETLINTVTEAAEAFLWEDESYFDAAKAYWSGVAGFALIMGTGRSLEGIYRALKNNSGKDTVGEQIKVGRAAWKGARRGAAEGAALPLTLFKWHYYAYEDVKRYGTGIKHWNTVRKAQSAMDQYGKGSIEYKAALELTKNAKLQRLRFYAEMFRKYNTIYEDAGGKDGKFRTINWKQHAKMGLSKARIIRLRINYANDFNKLLEKMIADGEITGIEAVDADITSSEGAGGVKTQALEVINVAKKAEEAIKAKNLEARTAEVTSHRQSGTLRSLGRKELAEVTQEQILRSRGIEPGSELATKYLEKWDLEIAKQLEAGKKTTPFMEFFMEGAKPTVILKASRGKAIARYLGQEFEIPSDIVPESAANAPTAEILGKTRAYCEQQWTLGAENMVDVTFQLELDAENNPTGKVRPKFNGQEIPLEALEGEGTLGVEAATKRYIRILQEGGKEIPPDFMARIAKYKTWIPQLEILLGTVGVAAMLYDLETARDKKEVLAKHCSVLLGALYAAGYVEKRNNIANPYLHFFVTLAAGVAGAFGGEKILGEALNMAFDYFSEKYGIPHATYLELGEALSTYIGYKFTYKPIVEFAARKGYKKALISFIEKRVVKSAAGNSLRASLTRIAGSQAVKRILTAGLGKGRAKWILGLFADDLLGLSPYAIVAIATDVVGAGLLLWSAKDIVEAVLVWQNAVKLEEELQRRESMPIKEDSIKITSQEALDLIAQRGIDLEALSADEDRFFDFLASLEVVEIEMARDGSGGKERYKFEHGVVTEMAMWKNGELYAEISGIDAEMFEEGIHEVERQNRELLESEGFEEMDVADIDLDELEEAA